MSLAKGKFGDAAARWALAVVATPSSAQLPIAHHLPAAAASARDLRGARQPAGLGRIDDEDVARVGLDQLERGAQARAALVGGDRRRRPRGAPGAMPSRSKSGTGCSTNWRSNCSSARIHLIAAGTLQFMFASMRIFTSEPDARRGSPRACRGPASRSRPTLSFSSVWPAATKSAALCGVRLGLVDEEVADHRHRARAQMPPSSSATGTPSALPLRSSSAISMPAIA